LTIIELLRHLADLTKDPGLQREIAETLQYLLDR